MNFGTQFTCSANGVRTIDCKLDTMRGTVLICWILVAVGSVRELYAHDSVDSCKYILFNYNAFHYISITYHLNIYLNCKPVYIIIDIFYTTKIVYSKIEKYIFSLWIESFNLKDVSYLLRYLKKLSVTLELVCNIILLSLNIMLNQTCFRFVVVPRIYTHMQEYVTTYIFPWVCSNRLLSKYHSNQNIIF